MTKPLSEKKTPNTTTKAQVIKVWSNDKDRDLRVCISRHSQSGQWLLTLLYQLSPLIGRGIFTQPQRNWHGAFSILRYSIIKLGPFCVHLKKHQLPLGQKQLISFLLTYFNLGVNSMMCQRQHLAFELSRQKAGWTPALSCRPNCINLQGTFRCGPNDTFHQLHPNYMFKSEVLVCLKLLIK